MVDTKENLRGLVLSAVEIKTLTGWETEMTEDYLNIIDNLITIAEALDAGIFNDITVNGTIKGKNRAKQFFYAGF